MFDSYLHFRDTPKYNKLIGEGFLVVEFKCPIEDEIFKSWSERHYISYVLSGKKKWLTQGQEWTLTSGQSIFVRKGAFLNKQYFEEDFCVLMFFLTDEFICSFVKQEIGDKSKEFGGPFQEKPIFEIEVNNHLANLYRSVFDYLQQAPEIPGKLVELKFRELLFNILNDQANYELRNFILQLAETGETPLNRIMEDNFLYNLSLDEFARLCGRSLSSFKRDFKQVYGLPPGKWLRRKRLDRARSLLLNTGLTAQEICFDVGFENSSHFNKKFKQEFGVTPLEYRRAGGSFQLQE